MFGADATAVFVKMLSRIVLRLLNSKQSYWFLKRSSTSGKINTEFYIFAADFKNHLIKQVYSVVAQVVILPFDSWLSSLSIKELHIFHY